MSKPPNSDQRSTEIIKPDRQRGGSADMDQMITTIRTRTAGRLHVVDGPGKGQSVDFFQGSNSIGRDASKNVVSLDFGDGAIHRDPHAYLTCQNGECLLSDNGQPNPVKVNGRMLSGSEKVGPADVIVIGMTTLRIELA